MENINYTWSYSSLFLRTTNKQKLSSSPPGEPCEFVNIYLHVEKDTCQLFHKPLSIRFQITWYWLILELLITNKGMIFLFWIICGKFVFGGKFVGLLIGKRTIVWSSVVECTIVQGIIINHCIKYLFFGNSLSKGEVIRKILESKLRLKFRHQRSYKTMNFNLETVYENLDQFFGEKSYFNCSVRC